MNKDESIAELNAVQYLRDFINTKLILSDEERKILSRISLINAKNKESYSKMENVCFSAHGLFLCKVCGKYKTSRNFKNNNSICNKCIRLRKDKEL